MVCKSMLASDSGEMDSALFLLSLGVSLGLEKRDTGPRQKETTAAFLINYWPFFLQITSLKDTYAVLNVKQQLL